MSLQRGGTRGGDCIVKEIETLKEQLDFDLDYLQRSVDVLNYSYYKAKNIGIKKSTILKSWMFLKH